MSYESLRFSWQKLLITQVPQKGGGGYGPPPPDYAAQWNAAQQAFNSANGIVLYAQNNLAKATASPELARDIITDVNNRANAELANIDSIINQTSGIPDYIFEGGLSKGEALSILQTTRNNISRCINVVPPPPPPPPPPVVPPPPTSPKLEPVASLLTPLTGPTVQMPVGPVIPIGCIPAPVIRCPIDEDISSPNPLQGIDGEWEPTGKIEGVGLGRSTPGGYSIAVMVFAENGKSYPSPMTVPLGLRWSYKPWRWRPRRIKDLPSPQPVVIPVPKTEMEILQQELAVQTKQLQAINRILNKPIDPAPSDIIYPSTSWQYEFWNKGYSLHEISYAEDQAARRNLLTTTNGDFALFKVKVEDLLQDAILAKSIAPAITQEIVPVPRCGTGNNGQPILIAEPPNVQMPYQPQFPDNPIPTPCLPPPPSIDLPKPYVDYDGKKIDPKKIPGYLRRNRSFISRGVRNRPIDLNDLPDVPTCTPNTVPRKGNWEDCVIGAGASVAELDSVRRTMAMSYIPPGADICEVAKNMLSAVRNPRATGLADPRQTASTSGSIFGQNPINTIPGVRLPSVTTANMIKVKAIAERRTQQARRGVLNNRK